MYQQLQILGHVGGDPVMRYLPDGTAFTNFSVATNRKFKNGAGQLVERTTWHRCTAWNGLAETVAQYVRKGSKVMVMGEVEANAYVNKRTGEPMADLEVRCQMVKFLDSAPVNQGEEPDPQGGGEEEVKPAVTANAGEEKEIPF